jgi:YesN/AraC family two-component response regulator
MGGKIVVQSPAADGVGTTFAVSLPIHQNAPMVAIASPDNWADLPVLSSDTEGVFLEEETTANPEELPLLLLIEDNTDVATYIQVCLKNRYIVDWANNGTIGIEKAFNTIPDVILSDVMMPEKDGFEVCQTLKNDERTSHIPIVLLTAKADVASRLEGLGVGADAYLSKPFLKEELFLYLEKLVELRRKLQALYAGREKDIFQKKDSPTEPAALTLDALFLQKIREFVEARLDDQEFGNTELARKMFLSESQLFRKIKALTGQSIALHIRSIRLQNARTMLQNSDRSVAEIAYLTGFNDPSYFTRVFSKEFGDLPGDLRK